MKMCQNCMESFACGQYITITIPAVRESLHLDVVLLVCGELPFSVSCDGRPTSPICREKDHDEILLCCDVLN